MGGNDTLPGMIENERDMTSLDHREGILESKPETEVVRFDWAMKYFLRHKANFDVLEGFLSELLKLDVTIDHLLESEVTPEAVHTKLSRVDVMANTPIGKVIIEVQVDRQYDFLSRVLYSTSKAVVDYMKRGDEYYRVKKVYSVSVLYFDLGHGTDYLYKGVTEFKGIHTHDTLSLNQQEKSIYQHKVDVPSDIFPEYYLIKVNQFRGRIKEKMDEWMYFFKNEKVKPEFTARGIQVAAEKLAVVKMPPEKRASYDRYIQDLSYESSMLHSTFSDGKREGKREGILEGKREGMMERTREIAQTLKAKGFSDQEIMGITGLSVSDLDTL